MNDPWHDVRTRAVAVGQRLRLLRTVAGLRQRDLAGLVGCDHVLISLTEHGSAIPSADVTVRLTAWMDDQTRLQTPSSVPAAPSATGVYTPGHRLADTDTAVEADRMHPGKRVTDRQRALDIHRRHPDGLTDFELAALMDRQQTSAGKRRHELVQDGYIVDSGRRRKSPSGANAIVWQYTKGNND